MGKKRTESFDDIETEETKPDIVLDYRTMTTGDALRLTGERITGCKTKAEVFRRLRDGGYSTTNIPEEG